jgi:DNA-binding response OmpR family regulator
MAQMRVLLVDDEEELVSTLGERFSLRGIEANAVMTGVDALNLIQEKDFDVVILDIKMPGMDGLQVLKKMREIRPGVKLILLTGRGSENECEKGLKEGACAYLVKPIKIEDLIKKMEEAANC